MAEVISKPNGYLIPVGREPFFDQMRAIAIVPVVVSHYYSRWLPGGGIGVGIFFALSGYLISRILLRVENFGVGSAVSFVFRRFMRIYPMYVTVIALALFLSAKVDPSRSAIIFDALPTLLTLNDVPPKWAGYTTGVLWTLHVEFAFYVSLPVAMLICGKENGLLLTAIGLILYSVFEETAITLISIGRLATAGGGGAIALGAMVAYFEHKKWRLPTSKWLFFLALLGLTILLFFPPSTVTIWRYQILSSALLASLLIASHLNHPTLLLVPGSGLIGVISYSMYLLHGLMIDYSAVFAAFNLHISAFAANFPKAFFTYAALLLGLATASYLAIERPGIELGSRIAKAIASMFTRDRQAA